jgi:hypothetical protein
MQLSGQRFVSLMAVQFILAAATSFSFCMVTLAQEPTSFEISLTPQAAHAISGQPFTYTLTITNISQQSSKDIMVFTLPTAIFLVGIPTLIGVMIGPVWILKYRQILS